MRCLALARYRFLILLRRMNWIFPVIAATAFFLDVGGAAPSFVSEQEFGSQGPEILGHAARAMLLNYLVHGVAVTMLCASFGVVPRRPEGVVPSDLIDSVPLSGQTRFWGDALGIFGATLALHLCATPLLAVAVALSPFSSSAFWIGEALMIAAIFFCSAGASWTLRAQNTRWSQTRSGRSGALLVSLIIITLICTTRIEDFRDDVALFALAPSYRTWGPLAGSIARPGLLAAMTLAIFGGYLAFYSIQASRAIERQ